MKKLLGTLALLSFLSACNQTQNAEQNNQARSINVKNSTIQEVDRKTGQDISRHLVELATSVPNVHDATAVVLGKYAIVGIDVNSKIDRSQVGSIKYSVAESLKKDPYGAKAVVVADPDTTQRLKDISAEIKKGRPVQGIMNELSDIAGRLMPEVPSDMINPNPKSGPEQPKKKLNSNEKQNLEQKQEKESNYRK